MATQTLFERLDGNGAVDAAVDKFYRRVLADDVISPSFERVDMEKQAAKQSAFLTMVFGGLNNYTGLDMRRGHARLVKRGLSDIHFDHGVQHLGDTFRELGVAESDIAEVAAIAESTRADVLDR